MTIQTKITVQQMMMKESGNYRVGKYPRYIITLGNSLSSVTVEELATAVDSSKASAAAAAASQAAAKTSETNAKTSETNAKASETAAKASQTAAAASQTASKTSETNAKASETAAKTSETNALASKNAAATSESNAKTSETNALASKNAAAASQTAAKTSETNAKTSETNAKTSETNAKASETKAKTSETNAKASEDAAAASVASITVYEPAPFPDVWAPLNDDLRLLAGFAPFDTLTISGKVLELPSKSLKFTRSTTATYIDKSGIVRTADINEPRFEREGLLMEGRGTNTVLYSGDQNAAWWPKARSATTSGFVAPDGSNSATKLMPTSELGSHYISKTLPVTTGSVYTLSYFVKAGEYTACRLSFSGTLVPDGKSCDFDLVAGTMNPLGTTGTPTMTPLSNGWYRCSITSDTIASDGTVNFNIWVLDENGSTSGFSGDSVKGIYVWGAQLEVNPVMTSYIPTTTSEVTRSPEALSLQASCNNAYGKGDERFNRTAALEVTVNQFGSSSYVNVLDIGNNLNNDIILRIDSSKVFSYRGSLATLILGSPIFNRKIFIQTIDDNNNISIYFNDQVATRVSAPVATELIPTVFRFSSLPSVVHHIRNFRIWHRVLTDNQIKGLR